LLDTRAISDNAKKPFKRIRNKMIAISVNIQKPVV
jgi:hypothetical protein